MTADQALKRLRSGNSRYVESRQTHPHQTLERRMELKEAQSPFAAVLGCSDSRVPPEIIFDLGIGDIFVVRTAGHIYDKICLGSIEYAAAHLHVPLIMVLGHSKCGAVQAALNAIDEKASMSGLALAIQPALEQVKEKSGDLVNNAAKANARIITERLKSSKPILTELIRMGKLKIVAAYYDLETGAVEVLS